MANRHKVGLVFGALLGGIHTAWSLLVAVGWAQPLVNFSMWAHMVHDPVTVGPFDGTAAITVIVIAAAIGYALGNVGAILWNKFHS